MSSFFTDDEIVARGGQNFPKGEPGPLAPLVPADAGAGFSRFWDAIIAKDTATEIVVQKCTFQRYILLDIAGRSSARVYTQSTVGNNGNFQSRT